MIEGMVSFGRQLDEVWVKRGLQELQPLLSFDVGGNLNIYHPRMGEFQGVFYNGKHLTSLSRGTIPEYNVYALEKHPDGTSSRGRIISIGWRTTFEKLVRRKIPGISWDNLCRKFSVEKKHFRGHASELEVA